MNIANTLTLNTYGFDARGIAKRFRHASIFGALESLEHGEAMRFVNDHDPLPLLRQIQERYGAQVSANYVSREPGNIVIDFTVNVEQDAASAPASIPMSGGCGSGGCGCSGGR
jgi:uncharacterized protein (DUF2249 family)